MFSKNKSNNNMAKKNETAPVTGGHNQIVNGTEIKGDVTSTGDIRIDGKLVGNLQIKGRLIVGTTGIIEGDIVCANATVSGTIQGRVKVSELISLEREARITGDIITSQISIEPGAKFTGTCSMDGTKAKAQ